MVMKRLLIVLMILLLLISGCSSEKSTSSLKDGKEELTLKEIEKMDIDDDIKEIAIASIDQPEMPTSFQEIMDAYDSGKITKEEEVLLTFIAAYAPDDLPKRYQGLVSHGQRNTVQAARWWMNEHWEELTPEWQEVFLPFYVLPDDERSFFHPANEDKMADWLKTLELIPSVDAQGPWWSSFQAQISLEPVDRRVKIFYQTNDPIVKQKALWANESMYKAWPMFESLLGGIRPTKMPYLYIRGVVNGSGEADMKDDYGRRCVMYVDHQLKKKEFQSTAIHELFHCFQFYIPLKYEKNADMWIMEATAAWTEDWVYPDYNIEWGYLPFFFKHMHKDMVKWDGENEYSSYPYYKFLTQYTGDLSHVKKQLINTKTNGGRTAATAFANFDNLWHEYMVWSWNKDPEERFTDTPFFPTGKKAGYTFFPNSGSLYSNKYNTKAKTPEFVTLEPLSGYYHEAIFENEDVEKVKFVFKEQGDAQHARHALIKIGDVWTREDWTYVDERKFCRKRPEENVKAVVLVWSNSNPNPHAADPNIQYEQFYDIDTRGECAPEWHGHTRWSWRVGWDFSLDGGALIKGTQTNAISSSYTSYDTLVYDEEEDEFVLKTQFINYQYDQETNAQNLNDCGTMWARSRVSYKGSGSKEWEIDEKYPSRTQGALTRLDVDDDDPMKYYVDVGLVPGDEFISVYDTSSSYYKPCPLFGIATPDRAAGATTEDSWSRTDRLKSEPNEIIAELNDAGDRITGSEVRALDWGGTPYTVLIEVDYSYS